MARGHSKERTQRGRSTTQDTDGYVGRRLRERRVTLGLSQQELAATMGVTYHQARKYENGINRIAAGRLFALAPALGVKIDYFFTSADAPEAEVKRSSQQRMLLDLSRNFIRMSRTHQRALCSLARLMAVSELKLVCASDDGTPHVAELLEHKLAG